MAVKPYETRSFPLKIPPGGQWLAIHAAKQPIRIRLISKELQAVCDEFLIKHWPTGLAHGAIVGKVLIDQVIQAGILAQALPDYMRERTLATGDFTPGRWAWRGNYATAFTNPLPYTGRQSLFSIDDAIIGAMT